MSPSGSATGSAEGEVLSAGRVHPKDDVLLPLLLHFNAVFAFVVVRFWLAGSRI